MSKAVFILQIALWILQTPTISEGVGFPSIIYVIRFRKPDLRNRERTSETPFILHYINIMAYNGIN